MPTLDDVLQILDGQDSDARVKVLQALLKKPEAAAVEEVAQRIARLAKDPDIATRFWAKKVAAKIAQPQAKPETKAESSCEGIDLLLRKLESASESTFISLDVIQKLCESKEERVLQPLVAYLQKCQDPIQVSFLTKQIGVNFPREELIPVLLPFLKHEDDRVKANTVEGLEGIHSPKCIVAFSQLLDHSSNRVRANAAKALSRFDPDQAFPILMKMVQQSRERPHFAFSALFAIGFLRDKRFIPAVRELLHEDLLFPEALQTIVRIGGDECAQFLALDIESFSDHEKRTSIQEAIVTLSNKKEDNFSEGTHDGNPDSMSDAPAQDMPACGSRRVDLLSRQEDDVNHRANYVPYGIILGSVIGYFSAHYCALWGGIAMLGVPFSPARDQLVPSHVLFFASAFGFLSFYFGQTLQQQDVRIDDLGWAHSALSWIRNCSSSLSAKGLANVAFFESIRKHWGLALVAGGGAALVVCSMYVVEKEPYSSPFSEKHRSVSYPSFKQDPISSRPSWVEDRPEIKQELAASLPHANFDGLRFSINRLTYSDTGIFMDISLKNETKSTKRLHFNSLVLGSQQLDGSYSEGAKLMYEIYPGVKQTGTVAFRVQKADKRISWEGAEEIVLDLTIDIFSKETISIKITSD